MKALELKPPKNENYCATVVALSQFVELPNCNNVKAALIFGNSVIVSNDTLAGEVGVFFPIECQLHKEFLGANSLFRKPEFGNADPTQKGYFELHGRVRAQPFRGNKSEGFWVPLRCLDYITNGEWYPPVGTTFDTLGEHEICRKYIPKRNVGGMGRTGGPRMPKLIDQIVDGQFRFHYDTAQLRRNAHKIQPNDFISISDKWHGTSAVIAKILVKRELPWYERLLQKLGVNIGLVTYGLTYSSRKVVKAVNGRTKTSQHFYSEDIWGVVAKEIEERIPSGFTVYGEIVGYTEGGKPIQPSYSYGCMPGTHKFLVYRVTVTTLEGVVVELPWLQMYDFCCKFGLTPVSALYYGRAKDLFPELDTFDVQWWQDAFLAKLQAKYVTDGDCPYNAPGIPAEGIVLRIDRLNESEAFKLKNFRFLEFETKMLDKGEVDMETAESEEEPASDDAIAEVL